MSHKLAHPCSVASILGGPENIDRMVAQYVETALWTEEDHIPADAEVSPQAIAQMRADCERFAKANAEQIEQWAGNDDAWEQAGHDFWLTRNGHGAGFWDRGVGEWPNDGEQLTAASKVFGGCDLYVGDDGKVHCDGNGPGPARGRTARSEIERLFANEDLKSVVSYRADCYRKRADNPRIHIGYRDATGDYAGVIVAGDENDVWPFEGLRSPQYGFNHASDSDAAYREMARCAFSFAACDGESYDGAPAVMHDDLEAVMCEHDHDEGEPSPLIRVRRKRPFFT